MGLPKQCSRGNAGSRATCHQFKFWPHLTAETQFHFPPWSAEETKAGSGPWLELGPCKVLGGPPDISSEPYL